MYIIENYVLKDELEKKPKKLQSILNAKSLTSNLISQGCS